MNYIILSGLVFLAFSVSVGVIGLAAAVTFAFKKRLAQSEREEQETLVTLPEQPLKALPPRPPEPERIDRRREAARQLINAPEPEPILDSATPILTPPRDVVQSAKALHQTLFSLPPTSVAQAEARPAPDLDESDWETPAGVPRFLRAERELEQEIARKVTPRGQDFKS